MKLTVHCEEELFTTTTTWKNEETRLYEPGMIANPTSLKGTWFDQSEILSQKDERISEIFNFEFAIMDSKLRDRVDIHEYLELC